MNPENDPVAERIKISRRIIQQIGTRGFLALQKLATLEANHEKRLGEIDALHSLTAEFLENQRFAARKNSDQISLEIQLRAEEDHHANDRLAATEIHFDACANVISQINLKGQAFVDGLTDITSLMPASHPNTPNKN